MRVYSRNWPSNQGRRAQQSKADFPSLNLTVNELLIAFWRYAEEHYRHPDGTPTGELENLKEAFRPLRPSVRWFTGA